jgi:CheY-like chemotaxis protein
MLQEDAEDLDESSLTDDLRKIESAGKHLLSVINDVLDLSKIEAEKMELFVESFALEPLLRDVVAAVEPVAAKRGNQLETRLEPGLGEMRADVTKLRQVLLNLLGNATKFTENGRIELAAARAQAADGRDWVELTIADSGIGMTSEQAERIFAPFQQADASTTRKYGGTGLGLAISRHFCRMMGGNVVVESAIGQGSTFTVRLPAVVAAPGDRTSPVLVIDRGGQATAPGGAKLHALVRGLRDDQAPGLALVVEDDPPARELLCRVLVEDGWQVLEAPDGRAALDRVAEQRPDVVMLDLLMPNMDGFAFVESLDRQRAEIPVVVVTAKAVTVEERLRLDGAVKAVLQKGTYDRRQLVGQLRAALEAVS